MPGDESRPNPTLGPAQEQALVAFLGGANVTEAATAAGVSRQTVSGWLNSDPDFIAEYQNRRAELWTGIENRLEVRLVKASDTVAALLDHSDWRARLAAARVLLDLAERHFPTQPYRTTPEAIVEDLKRQERNRKNAAEMDKLLSDLAV